MGKLKPYRKAIVGGLLAGLGALATALLDDSISPIEWVGVVSATLAGTGLVYAVPNKPSVSSDSARSQYQQEGR